VAEIEDAEVAMAECGKVTTPDRRMVAARVVWQDWIVQKNLYLTAWDPPI
jgi:hypothetical protein